MYGRCYGGGSPYFSAAGELPHQPQMWPSSAGASPTYGGSAPPGVALADEYSEAEAAGCADATPSGVGGALPAFNTRFGGAFACATSRPSTVYGSPALAANSYPHQVSRGSLVQWVILSTVSVTLALECCRTCGASTAVGARSSPPPPASRPVSAPHYTHHTHITDHSSER